MKRPITPLTIIFLVLIIPSTGNTQNYFYNSRYYEPSLLWEAGISIGGMNCLTDLGGNKGPGRYFIKDINITNTRFCGAAYVHALFNNIIGGRIEFTIGQVKAYDSILKTDNSVARYRYQRNLQFRSMIAEFSLVGEWYFLSQLMQQTQDKIPLWSPYLLTGISVFHFDPQASLNNNWISLRPLHTEGQGFKEYADRNTYSLTQFNLPIGLGFRYELSAQLNLQAEVVHRMLFTDYLDDVSTKYIDQSLFDYYLDPKNSSIAKQLADRRLNINSNAGNLSELQRGDPSKKDAFFSFNIKIAVVLNREKRF
ncbi:MAG: DUF6089 family protein [Chitinophagaceae bacterium]